MTVQEAKAKEVLNNIWDFADAQDEEKGDVVDDAIIEAIGCMEEVEQYRALGTVEELKEAREKQVAKKVIRQKGECYARTTDGKEYHEIILVCPNCHRVIKRTEALDVHCKYCGQALDWSEE